MEQEEIEAVADKVWEKFWDVIHSVFLVVFLLVVLGAIICNIYDLGYRNGLKQGEYTPTLNPPTETTTWFEATSSSETFCDQYIEGNNPPKVDPCDPAQKFAN